MICPTCGRPMYRIEDGLCWSCIGGCGAVVRDERPKPAGEHVDALGELVALIRAGQQVSEVDIQRRGWRKTYLGACQLLAQAERKAREG